MLSGEKILITGPSGRVAYGISKQLARDNEVWGIARFGNLKDRARVEALGVKTLAVDLAGGRLDDLPTDFTYLLHLAATIDSDDYDHALRVNAEATGFLLSHCRKAKAALVMSSTTVYKPHPDPWHAFREDDPLGGTASVNSPATYALSKMAGEAVARYCAREFRIPVIIPRLNAAYGTHDGLPAFHLRAIAAGKPAQARWYPCPYSLVHYDDIQAQVEAMLGAASVPATIVNWGGDDVVSVQEYCAYMGELLGVDAKVDTTEIPGASRGAIMDATRRLAITGPARIGWREGIRRLVQASYPERARTGAS